MKARSRWANWGGAALLALSFLFYGALLGVPFLPISTASKVALSPALVLLGEAAFWIGSTLIGAQMVARYKHYFDLGNWVNACKRWKERR